MDDSLYTGRDYGVVALLIIVLVSPFLSSFGTTPAVECKRSRSFTVLSCVLLLSHVTDSVTHLVESSRSRGELPDPTASFLNTLFVCIIAIRLETLPTKEKAFGWYLDCAFWLLLLLIELSTAVRIALRPSLPSPYFQVGISLASFRALTCIILLVLFLRSYHVGYRSLAQSDPENNNRQDADSEDVDNDDGDGGAATVTTTTDHLGLRKESYREVEEAGGWIAYVKKFRIFLQYIWPFGQRSLQIRFVVTFILLLAQRLVSVQEPLWSAALIDTISTRGAVWRPFTVYFSLRFLNSNMCLTLLKNVTWIDVDIYRRKMLKKGSQFKVMKLDKYFHMLAQPTDIIKAIDNAGSVDKLLDAIIFDLLPNAFTLVATVYSIYRRFGLFMIIIVMYMATSYAFVEKRSVAAMMKEYSKYVTARDSHERRRQDGVRGWQTVSVHNQVEHENKLYDAEVGSFFGQWRSFFIVLYFFRFVNSFIFQISHIIGYALVISMVYTDRCTIGDLTAFLGLWGLLLGPIDYFTTIAGDMLQNLFDAARLRKIMEQQTKITAGSKSLTYEKGEVRLERLCFSYPGSEKLHVDDLSLTIEGGTKVAFVGPSGTGKSTLFSLLVRQLLPTKGAIFIDGQDIATVTRDSLHEHVAMMSQEPYIFNDTVMYNVRYPRPIATDEECHEACRKAGIHDIIMARKGGYQARTGENGANFSGGERQRMVIARAFVAETKIMLIDEGTSALDSETEVTIKRSINKKYAGKTVIIVAHRLSSIKHVDRILVLGKGCKIVEDGKHDELLAKNGVYADYWNKHLGEGGEEEESDEAPLIRLE